MRKFIKKYIVLIIFGIILAYSNIVNTNFHYQSTNNEQSFEGPRDFQLKQAGINPFWNYTTGSTVLSIGISNDSKYIAAGSWDHKLYFFSNSSSTPLWSYDTGCTVPSVAVSSNGSYIAIGNGWPDCSIYLFHKSSSTPLWSYSTGDGYPRVAISGDGNYIAVAGSQTHNVYLFHRSSSTPLWSFDTGNLITAVAISEDGSYIAAGGYNDKVYLFERSSSTPLWSYTTNGNIIKIDISSDGNYIVAGGSGDRLYVFNKSSSLPMWSYNLGDSVESVAISSNGENIVIGGNDHKIYYFYTLNSTPAWNYTTEGTVYSVAISAEGDYIVAGSVDKNIYLFERFSSVPLWKYMTEDQIGDNDIPHCVKISSDGKYITAGSHDNRIYYFKWNPLNLLRLYSNAEDPDIDGRFILYWNNLTGTDNYSVYLYNSYITEINSSLTLLADQNATSPFLISGLTNGTYYYIIVAFIEFGNISSNCIFVEVKLFPPTLFTLATDADVPDLDGSFNLTWTDSLYVDNYSVYLYNSYITEVNSSLTLLADQNATSPFPISGLSDGDYYYIAIAYNKFGETMSNNIMIKVQRKDPEILIPGYNLFVVLGILSVAFIIISKKAIKSF